MNIKFYKYCPLCKSELVKEINKVYCSKCNFAAYNNQAACAACLLVKQGKVLLAIRKFEPYKGAYDLIGGFLEPMEQPPVGALREMKEETGLDVKIIKTLGIYTDVYGKMGQFFIAWNYIVKIIKGTMVAMDDVSNLKWVPINDVLKLKNTGFKTTQETLKDLHCLYIKNPKYFSE